MPSLRRLQPMVIVRGHKALFAAFLLQVWGVLPSLVSPPAATASAARLIARQVGAIAVPYLTAAPLPLITYLVAGYAVSLPILMLLAQDLRIQARIELPALAARIIARFGFWVFLYASGSATVVAVAISRGMAGPLVLGWAPRLAIYGVLTALPQVGFVFGSALAFPRLSRFLVIVCVGALSCSLISAVLVAREVEFPSPMLLRAELLSGRAELVLSSALGLAAWGAILLTVGIGFRTRRLAMHSCVEGA